MALQENIRTYSYESDDAIGQFLLVKYDTVKRTATLATAAADAVIGATLNRVEAAGQALTVAREGIIKVRAGAAITAGQGVAAGAGGKAFPGAGFGTAIQDGAIDEIIEVQWGAPLGASA